MRERKKERERGEREMGESECTRKKERRGGGRANPR